MLVKELIEKLKEMPQDALYRLEQEYTLIYINNLVLKNR